MGQPVVLLVVVIRILSFPTVRNHVLKFNK